MDEVAERISRLDLYKKNHKNKEWEREVRRRERMGEGEREKGKRAHSFPLVLSKHSFLYSVLNTY